MASKSPLDLQATATAALELSPGDWAQAGVLSLEDIMAARAADGDGLARLASGAPPITDDRNLLRMRSPGLGDRALGPTGADQLLAEIEPLRGDAVAGLDAPYLVRRLIRQGSRLRARHLASHLEDPAARRSAQALVALSGGQRRRAQFHLSAFQGLESWPPEAEAALLQLHRWALQSGQPLPWLERASDDLGLVVEGWRMAAADDWRGLKTLEDRLSRFAPTHPLFGDSLRLRVAWRARAGSPEEAQCGLELLSPLLSPLPAPGDLLLRARLGLRHGQPAIALASLEEARFGVAAAQRRQISRGARRLLETIEVEADEEAWRQDLLSQWSADKIAP